MEVYKILLHLKNEPCFDSLKKSLDEFYKTSNLIIAHNYLIIICSSLQTLGYYNLISFSDINTVKEILEKSLDIRFKDYSLYVRSNIQRNDVALVPDKSFKNFHFFIFGMLLILVVIVILLFNLSPDLMNCVFDYWKTFFTNLIH